MHVHTLLDIRRVLFVAGLVFLVSVIAVAGMTHSSQASPRMQPAPTPALNVAPPPPPPMPIYVSGEAAKLVRILDHECHVLSFSPGHDRYPFQVDIECSPYDGAVPVSAFELVDSQGQTYEPLESSQPAMPGNAMMSLRFDPSNTTTADFFLRYKPVDKTVPLAGETLPVR